MKHGSICANRNGDIYQMIRRPQGHQTIFTWLGTRVDGPSAYECFSPTGEQVDRSSPWRDLAKEVTGLEPRLLVSVGDSVCLIDHPYIDQLRATCIVSAARPCPVDGAIYHLEHIFKDDGAQRVSPSKWVSRREFVLVSKATKESLAQLNSKVFKVA